MQVPELAFPRELVLLHIRTAAMSLGGMVPITVAFPPLLLVKLQKDE